MRVTSNLPAFSLISAVFIFGGYPKRSWEDAFKELMKQVRFVAGFNEISPTSLFVLGRIVFGKDYKFL